MLFYIANLTDIRLDVWWRCDTDSAFLHRGTVDPGSEVLAVDPSGTAIDVDPGTQVLVRGVAPDGRLVLARLTIAEAVKNVAELPAAQLREAEPALTLPEELLLLATDSHGHTHNVGLASFRLGLLTAAILELELRGKVQLAAGVVQVVDPSPTGDAVLDDTLEIFATAPGGPMIDVLTGLVDSLAFLHQHVLEGLVDKGVLSQERDRLLWLIPRWHYETADEHREHKLINRLLEVLVLNEAADPRTAALLSIYALCFTDDGFLREQLLSGLPDRLYEIVNTSGDTITQARDAMGGALANAAELRLPQYGV
jgi:Golgi phosphoprotein 3